MPRLPPPGMTLSKLSWKCGDLSDNEFLEVLKILGRHSGGPQMAMQQTVDRLPVMCSLAARCIGRADRWMRVLGLFRGKITKNDIIPSLRILIRDFPTETVQMLCAGFEFGPDDSVSVFCKTGADGARFFGDYAPTIVELRRIFKLTQITPAEWMCSIEFGYNMARRNGVFSVAGPEPNARDEMLANLVDLIRLAIADAGRDAIISQPSSLDGEIDDTQRQMRSHFMATVMRM